MEASEMLATIEAMHGEARARKLFFQTASDGRLRGRDVTLDGRSLLSFSSCSYLGLEHHPKLVTAVHDAVDRWGTQFSSSRGYISAPPYQELEALLSELFGGSVLVTSSTTIGHQIALGVLATEKDAIVLDHQVHHSVQMAATIARANGAQVELVRHNELDRAEEIIARLARIKRTVWFACDGVFSMYGDLAPVGLLHRLLSIAPNVRLYIDDAHGMSWAGRHGRGSFLSRFPMSDRVVMGTSLNKAFSAGGGCLVFASEHEREKVRMCGAPFVFSGPLQPPMLGAALASARVHLSDEIVTLQQALRRRVDLCNRLMRERALPLLVENESPIFFVRLGLPRVAFAVAERLRSEGVYVNVSMYPTVPMKRAGIRLGLTVSHSLADIERVVDALARHVPAAMEEEGLSRTELDALFARAIPAESMQPAAPGNRVSSIELKGANARVSHPVLGAAMAANDQVGRAVALECDPASLTVEHHHTIHAVERDFWNRMFGAVGACSWDAMALQEQVFRNRERREHNWNFDYVIVRRSDRSPVAASFFTTSLIKDDMFVRDSVSRAVEMRRREDPYFLTSVACMMGSQLSEGNHLWIDREGPWRSALRRMLEVATDIHDRSTASMLMLRDLPADDPDMDAFMLDAGFVKLPVLDSHVVDVNFHDDETMLARLGKRARSHVRQIMASSPGFTRTLHGAGTGASAGAVKVDANLLKHLHGLYRNVASRKLRINVFELPEALLPALLENPAWEVVTLTLKPEAGGAPHGRPVAWYAAHVHGDSYTPFFCGLDYDYVYTHGVYRQMLYQILNRASERGMRKVNLGMDADMEKSRFGTSLRKNCVYVQAQDHFNGELLREIAAEVGVRNSHESVRVA